MSHSPMTRPPTMCSIRHAPGAVARAGLVVWLLASVPEQVVELGGRSLVPEFAKLRDEQLDRVNGRGPDLDLLGRAGQDQFLAIDPSRKRRLIAEQTGPAKDVRDQVVGEERQTVEVAEPARGPRAGWHHHQQVDRAR